MITYNHANFIAQAVESVMMQKTDFPYELVISDDCSQDGTREIVLGLQQRYPDRIRLLLPEKNLGMMPNFVQTLRACTGDYIALVEGDDYWLDPHKLQRQVALLETHPEFSACFVRARQSYDHDPGYVTYFPTLETNQETFGTVDLIEQNYIATASVMYRNFIREIDFIPLLGLSLGDWPLHILASLRGPIGFIPEVMAVYRIHKDGIWSGGTEIARLEKILRMYHALSKILPANLNTHIIRNLEKNCRLISMELVRTEVERKKKQLKRLRRRLVGPLLVGLLYLLSFGPFMMFTRQVQPPSELVRAVRHVEGIVYLPWKAAYTHTVLHDPLGYYMHLWCPQLFDENGDLLKT